MLLTYVFSIVAVVLPLDEDMVPLDRHCGVPEEHCGDPEEHVTCRLVLHNGVFEESVVVSHVGALLSGHDTAT